MTNALRTQAWHFESLGGPEGLELIDQDLPQPGPGEALLRIEAIGLNRSDLAYMAGRYIKQPPSPSFLGQEAVGEIVALGDRDASAAGAAGAMGYAPKVGDRVGLLVGRIDFADMGTFRRHGIFPQSALLPWPGALGPQEGAGLWVAGLTAAGGLRTGGLTPGSDGTTVLITAASSGVGLIALQLARAWGAKTLASTTSEAKVEALGEYADHVLHTPEAEKLGQAVLQATDGRGVDLAFDPVGFAYAPGLFESVATDGHIVGYGIMAGAPPTFDLVSLLRKDAAFHGYTIYRLLRHPSLLDTVVGDVLKAVESGDLRPRVASAYAFEQAPEALAAMATNQHLGKIVVTVDD